MEPYPGNTCLGQLVHGLRLLASQLRRVSGALELYDLPSSGIGIS